jgi:hypothetical protein
MLRSTLARLIGLAEIAAFSAGCSGGETKYIGSNQTAGATAASNACPGVPTAPPSSLGLGAFYGKYLDASGIPVVSSASVADQALTQACNIVVHMLVERADVRQAMIDNSVRMAVIGTGEVTTDLPEYSDLYTAFPNSNWDQMRGVGATRQRPVSSCGEENLLCLSGDIFQGMSILVQTVAYAMEDLGIPPVDDTFTSRRQTLYDDAMAAGRFADTFATQGPGFYFAVGVQDWFDTNREASPADGTYNEINTRVELKAYDPGLAALIGEYLPGDSWRPACP